MNGEEADTVFRVCVSLERYFSDERARCYMSVTRGRPVRSLARRLRRAFALPRPFALLSRGHLLPPDEPLALLQPDDPVQVIPTNISPGPELYIDKKQVLILEESSDATSLNPEDANSRAALTPATSSPRSLQHDEVDGIGGGLDDMKRRALEILEGYEAAAPPAPARRRRRVRRRRPALAPLPPPSPLPSPPPDSNESAQHARAVLRNGSSNPRAARLVRPLSEHSPPPAALAQSPSHQPCAIDAVCT